MSFSCTTWKISAVFLIVLCNLPARTMMLGGGGKDLVFRRGVFSPNKRHALPPFQPAGFTFYFHVHLCMCVPPSIKIQACQYISPSRTCDLHAVGFLFSTRCEFADNFHPGQCLRKWSSYCFDNGAEREALVYLWYT